MLEKAGNEENTHNGTPAANQGQPAPAALSPAEAVVRALENPKYDWRTVQGVARETGLAEERVEEALAEMRNILVHTCDESGRSLFTTREYYNRTASWGRKLLAALTDKIV